MIYRKLKDTGDTIVEVLIAVVVVSSVLVGAFTIANKSASQIRGSQERAEAVKWAAGAVEVVKAKSTNASSLPLNVPYCIDLTTPAIGVGGSLPTPLSSDDDSQYANNCKSTAGVTFSTSITRVSGSEYEIHTRWDNINGQAAARQDVTISYRSDK